MDKIINGINYITDENGVTKAILLDLIQFKKDDLKAEVILDALSGLQSMIDESRNERKTANSWEIAKEKLKGLNP